MPPNWDDQFDFDELQPKQAAKKGKQEKKVKKNEDDFFDLQDDPPQKVSKLPTINQKPKESSISKIPAGKSNKNIKNDYDDYEEIDEQVQEVKTSNKKVSKKSLEKQNYYEQLEDQQKIKPAQVKKLSQKVNKQEDEQFYQSIEDAKPLKQEPKAPQKNHTENNPKEQPVESDYEQNFDQYGEDFEEVQEKPKEPKKSQTTVNLKSKDKKQMQKPKPQQKKLVINTNKVFTNKQEKQKDTKNVPPIPKPPQKENSNKPSKKYIEPANDVSKPKTLQKSSSKRSLQSNDSKKYLSNSKVSTNKRTMEISLNRHMDLVEKQFPESQQKIKEYNNDKLSRLNQQVRQMIRKFNEELNELINKNMILLKDKPVQKVAKVDEKVRVLEEQLKSGATAIQVAQNELDRLKGRQGELREEEYQLMMQKKIEDMKEVIKQTTKQIVKLKFEVNNQGNKLSKHQVQKKLSQQLHQIKMTLLQAKKEEEKNDVKIEKMDKMIQELQTKNSDKGYQLDEQIDNAKQKGISLNVTSAIKRRYDELKLKVLAVQNHKKCMEGLNRTKCDHLNHENQQIKINIKNVESQINNFIQSIQHSQEESIAIIKKAKENTRFAKELVDNLDKILKSIQQNQALNYYEVRTEGNKSQASQRPLKQSMYENMSKQKENKQKPPLRTNSSKKQPNSATKQKVAQAIATSSDEINLMKPNFMKKKQKAEAQNQQQKTNKLYERVWNEQQQKRKEQEKKKQEKRKQQEKKRLQQQKKKQAEQQALEEQKKKPFNLKRNRQNKEKSIEQSPQPPVQKKIQLQLPKQQKQQVKQEEKPSLGPKFMRLNKKDKNNEVIKNQISVQKPIAEQIKKVPEEKLETKASEEEQPVFVPKRFNLRNKLEKKEQSYVPTIEKVVEVKKEEPKEKEIKKQYTPNFSFKEEEPFKAPIIEPKKPENDKIAEVIQQKPRFNLRLRDRKKEGEGEYVPTKLTEPVDIKPKVDSNSYNPLDRVIPNKDEKPAPKKQQDRPYMLSVKPKISQKQAEMPTKQQTNLNIPTLNQNNAYAPKAINNPYAQPQKEEISNPYAPKQELPKRQKQGPLKKNKILNKGPKEKFNIYEQVEQIAEPQVHIPVNQPPKQQFNQPPKQQINLAKTDELDLNAMLGIKKKDKGNDLDDLLGQVKVQKKKQKKKNTDFFNDLEL